MRHRNFCHKLRHRANCRAALCINDKKNSVNIEFNGNPRRSSCELVRDGLTQIVTANIRQMVLMFSSGYSAIEAAIFTTMKGWTRRRGQQNDCVSAAPDLLSNLIDGVMDESSFRHGASRVFKSCPARSLLLIFWADHLALLMSICHIGNQLTNDLLLRLRLTLWLFASTIPARLCHSAKAPWHVLGPCLYPPSHSATRTAFFDGTSWTPHAAN